MCLADVARHVAGCYGYAINEDSKCASGSDDVAGDICQALPAAAAAAAVTAAAAAVGHAAAAALLVSRIVSVLLLHRRTRNLLGVGSGRYWE